MMKKSIETMKSDIHHIDGWTPSQKWIRKTSEVCQISSKEEIRPCGCGVKLDLQDVVYPALAAADEKLSVRVDNSVHPGRFIEANRFILNVKDLVLKRDSLINTFREIGMDTVIELFSTSRDGFIDRHETKSEVADIVKNKIRILQSVPGLSFGKGHSIRAGGDVVVLDMLRHDASSIGYTISNNDTIITADSILRHFAPVSVITALNNALNDIYLTGAIQNLVVRPTYDGTAEEVAEIRKTFALFEEFHRSRGVDMQIIDEGPLNQGIKVVGGTAIGYTDREIPVMSGLKPGQEILLTRFLGDLSLLALHRGLHFTGADEDLKQLRIEVLQRFATSNYPVAKILTKYLPSYGQEFDEDLHVTFASDVSGPGLFVLEEAARQSGVDVSIDRLKFIDERSLNQYRKNQTSSTNGPLMIAGKPSVLAMLESDLQSFGMKETWRLGRVLGKSAVPTIYIHPSLRDRYTSGNPRTDFFAPEVHFGKDETFVVERMPIFERYKFDIK